MNLKGILGKSRVTAKTPQSGTLTLGFFPCDGALTSCASGNTGSLKAHTITLPNLGSLTQVFAYDGLNRLLSAGESGVGTQWSQTYSYDAAGPPLGNRWVANSTGFTLSSLTPTMSSNYAASNSNQLMTPATYVYDANGNQTSAPNAAASSTFDAEGRMLSNILNAVASTYTYDGEGQRVMKVTSSGAASATTTYVYDASGNLAAEYTTGSNLPSGVISPCGSIAINSTTTCYVTVDQLGSTRMVTDSSGSVWRRYDYLPSGEEIPIGLGGRTSGLLYQLSTNTASTETTGQYGDGFSLKFTGQIRDYETGLDYMNARYYSPAQGRFISPDPANAGADPTNPQTWNGYAYVGNNPTSVSDPDGLGFWSSFGNFFLNLGLDFLTGGLNAILGGVHIGASAGSIGGCGGPLGNCGTLGSGPWSEGNGLGDVQDPGRFIMDATAAPSGGLFGSNDADIFTGFGPSLIPVVFWPKFKKIDCAGYTAVSSILTQTRQSGLEWGGYIFRSGAGYTFSEPIRGTPVALPGFFKIPTPDGMQQAGWYHTHPKVPGHDANRFSWPDVFITSHLNGYDGKGPGYLGVPSGTILKLSPGRGSIPTSIQRGVCSGN